MKCQRCKSDRLFEVSGKCSDMFYGNYKGKVMSECYVPSGVGIGGVDYLELTYCLDCGQIQHANNQEKFPIDKAFDEWVEENGG